MDISFVDAEHGWLLGSACDAEGSCRPGLRATSDGGRTWEPLPDLPTSIAWTGGPQTGNAIRGLRFASLNNGWTFNPGLFRTADGGQTWVDEHPGSSVFALEPSGESAWSIQGNCGLSPVCELSLMIWNGSEKTWAAAASQPEMGGPNLQVLRKDERDAWILTWDPAKPAEAKLAVTADGGSSWRTFPSPCPGGLSFSIRLAALDRQHLWAACGGMPGAGQQMKSLVLSKDGGQSWEPLSSLPGGGYIRGYINDITWYSPEQGVLGLGRGTLFETQDGGLTWNPCLPLEQANPSDASGWRIQFVDPQHGWAALQNQVFSTTDGGSTWKLTEIH